MNNPQKKRKEDLNFYEALTRFCGFLSSSSANPFSGTLAIDLLCFFFILFNTRDDV